MSSNSFDLEHNNVTSIKSNVMVGAIVLAVFIFGFGIWAVSAPLKGAVIASGWVAKQGNTQSIIHEHGGVVAGIFAREGEKVNKGDILVAIADPDRQANHNELVARISALNVMEQRLEAEFLENAGFDATALRPKLEERSELIARNADLEGLMADQMQEYKSRKVRMDEERRILQSQRISFEKELIGIRSEIAAVDTQLRILQEQRSDRVSLVRQGYGRRVDLQQTERSIADLTGERARLEARETMLPHQIDEVTARLGKLNSGFREDVSEELADLRVERLALKQKLEAAQTAMARVELKAPVSGVINKIHVNTVGSAIGAYQPIVEVVPDDNPLLVELEVSPADIEDVKIGQPAQVVLSAYDQGTVEPVEGVVEFVSPDRHVNERTQVPYFVARLKVSEETTDLPEIFPGMPVEAYLVTSERTFAEILLAPLTKSLRRAFRS